MNNQTVRNQIVRHIDLSSDPYSTATSFIRTTIGVAQLNEGRMNDYEAEILSKVLKLLNELDKYEGV